MDIEGKIVITEEGVEFRLTSLMAGYDSEYLFRQLLKCDVYVSLRKLEGHQPRLVFPFVRRLDDDRT